LSTIMLMGADYATLFFLFQQYCLQYDSNDRK
jgi:hypothetical protein